MRQNNGRKSFCIIDAQSIKNADTAEAMMQARRFQGRIAVDTQACNLYNNSRDN
ncbi:MAG: hypothetical protein O7149_03850 [Wolbachia endosymbiont of Hylaeus sinuatus]|uniref:hypothetical protein n=1 Tax=Wolbachia endosymbiont (group A) of Paraperithous gnathaulax TaxID=3066212 RepID=UPI0002E698A0|nr:hypothetical protein [Wolbachia endosymbiont of Hylaeus sinuatus]MDX5543380.1 hypothetical protein [Wolbachia endosymbiont of Andrena apicata]ONI57016.1 hypothetical protein N499_1298 [Wolbachia pipientis wVitA]RLT61270.1 hypothetical protein WANA31_0762 [Wolbachia endosymbiont of Drosophila ananassae]RLT61674.1 hypothetical protein WANA13_0802 [Wolbachia endosymbiont of Drosophila ananassae]